MDASLAAVERPRGAAASNTVMEFLWLFLFFFFSVYINLHSYGLMMFLRFNCLNFGYHVTIELLKESSLIVYVWSLVDCILHINISQWFFFGIS